MPQKIGKRFNGDTKEAIEYTRIWGRDKAREKYAKKYNFSLSGSAFDRFIEGETNDPLFGLRPTLGGTGNNTWAEDLLDAFVRKISQMETQKQHLESELHQTKLELEYYKGQQALRIEPKISQVMERCRI